MTKLLLLLLSSLKFGKLATTGGSMLLSLGVYAAMWGWRFAAGFIGLLFLHEMGHFIAARQRGLPVGAPTFVPFLGAWIEMKEMPHNAETEAYVGLGGPLFGTVASLAVYIWSRQTDSNLLLAIAYSGLFLNLFNLLPVSPLDGGRITQVLSPRIWLVGAPIMLALLFYRPSPALIIIAVLAVPQLLAAWRHDPNDPAHGAYYDTPLKTRIEYAIWYLALVGLLGVMTYEVHDMLSGVRT